MKKSILFSILILSILVTSCISSSSIPTNMENDNVRPTISFYFYDATGGEFIMINFNEITINGMKSNFNFTRDALYLPKDIEYPTAIFAIDDKMGGENGSLEKMTLTMPKPNIIETPNYTTEDDLPEFWTESGLGSATTRTFRFTSSTDPTKIKDGAAISPTLKFNTNNMVGPVSPIYDFVVTAEDHRGNSISKTLKISFSNEDSPRVGGQ